MRLYGPEFSLWRPSASWPPNPIFVGPVCPSQDSSASSSSFSSRGDHRRRRPRSPDHHLVRETTCRAAGFVGGGDVRGGGGGKVPPPSSSSSFPPKPTAPLDLRFGHLYTISSCRPGPCQHLPWRSREFPFFRSFLALARPATGHMTVSGSAQVLVTRVVQDNFSLLPESEVLTLATRTS